MAKETNRKMPGAGMLPPQDIDIEEAVLGTIIEYPQTIITIIQLLKPEIFYQSKCQIICEVILKLHHSARKIDAMVIVNELRKAGNLEMIGGVWYLTELTTRSKSPITVQDHIRIVYEYYLLREQISFFTQQINKCYELANPFDVISDTTRRLDELNQGTMISTEIHISELSVQAVKERQENPGKIKEILGIPSGMQTLDKAIGGFQDGQLIIVAGRPAMGKTAFALAIAKGIGVTNRVPIAIFSLEMSGKQLYNRFQASTSQIESRKIKYNNLDEVEQELLERTDGELSNCPIYIDETPALNIDSFRAKATIMKHKYGIRAIVIDYLQLMKGSKNNFNKEAEISEISGKLKQVAKELKLPIIALAQLSRDVEKRGGAKIPQLSDIRDSGSIEQDADVVMFLWRPAYYEITEAINFRHFNMDLLANNLLAISIAKQREGETYILPLEIILKTMQIHDHPAIVGGSAKVIDTIQTTLDITPIPNDEPPF